MGYLYFYSESEDKNMYDVTFVLVPYGVSIFLFERFTQEVKNILLVLVPYGVSIFLFD